VSAQPSRLRVPRSGSKPTWVAVAGNGVSPPPRRSRWQEAWLVACALDRPPLPDPFSGSVMPMRGWLAGGAVAVACAEACWPPGAARPDAAPARPTRLPARLRRDFRHEGGSAAVAGGRSRGRLRRRLSHVRVGDGASLTLIVTCEVEITAGLPIGSWLARRKA
jgi:hypothetical protein